MKKIDGILQADNTTSCRLLLIAQQALHHLHHNPDAFETFRDGQYRINEVKFELTENGGLGHAEVVIKYTATPGSGEDIRFNSPFKIYTSYDGGYWWIFHIVFRGFRF